jgi:DNA-binding protein
MINFETNDVLTEITKRYKDYYLIKFVEDGIKVNDNGEVIISGTDYNINKNVDTILVLKDHVRDTEDYKFEE